MRLGDNTYRKLLHRYNQLELQRGMSDRERLEYVRIGRLLTLTELVRDEREEAQHEQYPSR